MLRGILKSRGFDRCPLTRRDAHLYTCKEYTECHSLHLIPLTMPLEAPIGDPERMESHDDGMFAVIWADIILSAQPSLVSLHLASGIAHGLLRQFGTRSKATASSSL